MTMSDDGDRTCPLCAEEMDITDQQLKPCKCGYEICVWCWHHIMDMAEKEETEGRCPACRTRYDKDRIVKMAASCERMVAEINAEKKQKTHKVKAKAATVEAKKHLASVRVIQRNLVYIIGLPASLCDESILERREYFGQYGKVLKVSVSRPTGATSQQASTNNSFSVYITYAREEEAIRCIQAVHNFVLEGKVLRACFGTTKYCHAWLRNMTCGNPDCLYLHDVGSQEDSFTKDEIISAFTRTRVPQMASSVSQRRAGTVLPPPADDFSYSAVVSAKHTVKNGTINTTNQTKLSPPNSSSGSLTLPPAASWGLRNLSSRTTAASVISSQSLTKLKTDSQNNSILNSSTISSTRPPSAWNDDVSTVPKVIGGRQVSERDGLSKTLKPYKPGIAKETQTITSPKSSPDIDFSIIPSSWNDDEDVTSAVTTKGSEERQVGNGNGKPMCSVSSKPIESGHLPSKLSTSPNKEGTAVDGIRQGSSGRLPTPVLSTSEVKGGDDNCHISSMPPSKSPASKVKDNHSNYAASEKLREDIGSGETDIQKVSIGVSSVTLDGNNGVQSLARHQPQNAIPYISVVVPSTQDMSMEQSHSKCSELLSSANKNDLPSSQSSSDKQFDWNSEMQSRGVMASLNDMGSSSRVTDGNDIRMLGVADPTSSSPPYVHLANTSHISSWNDTESKHSFTSNGVASDTMMQTRLFTSVDNASTLSNGHQEGLGIISTPVKGFEHPRMGSHLHESIDTVRDDNLGSFDKAISVNKDESSIISDILSLEFDPWDESCSTANNFVKMLGESEKNDKPFNMSSAWKSKTSNKESRFSFARQDNQGSLLESSLRNCGHGQNFNLLSQSSCGNVYQNGLTFQSLDHEFPKNSLSTLDRVATGTSRSKISAPPGFSAPSRIPPPGFSSGFSSHDGFNQVYDLTYSESRPLDNLLVSNTNHYQPQLARNSSDIEFMDPAILAVGKGRMTGVSDSVFEPKNIPTFPAQFLASNNDPRLQLLMQQTMSSHQNLRLRDHIGDAFNPTNDNYLASRHLAQNHASLSPHAQVSLQQPRNSHLTNGQWDGWSDLRLGNNIPMSDLLRSLYPTEANNFHIPSSNDLYNRAFGL